jgi:exopolyphosphatase/pppGpp-phosphohydrolase
MPPVTIAAAVDIGSNSIHLLIAALDGDGLRPLIDESVQLGVGDVVDREGFLPPAARDSVVAALESYATKARSLGATTLTLLATEPLRRASNRSVIQADVLRATGLPLQIISHDTEAQLTLLGVTGGRRQTEPLLVVDVGGGSSELIVFAPGRDSVVGALPTGSSRLSKQFVSHDPPTWFEINALRAEAVRLVQSVPTTGVELHPARGIGVGGSATNLAHLPGSPLVPGALDRAMLDRIFSILAAQNAQELSTAFDVSLRRAKQLAAGAALLEAVIAHYDLHHLDVSTASLREGAVIAAQHGPDWLQQLPSLIA